MKEDTKKWLMIIGLAVFCIIGWVCSNLFSSDSTPTTETLIIAEVAKIIGYIAVFIVVFFILPKLIKNSMLDTYDSLTKEKSED